MLLPLCGAAIPEGFRAHERVRPVLEAHYILIQGSGIVGVEYDVALNMLEAEDLLTLVQTAYEELLEEGETAEFTIEQTEPGEYSFVNSKRQFTRILELHRAPDDEGGMELLLYSEGTRSFGDFQALTHLRVRACPENHSRCVWTVEVYAYPSNSLSRYFARNLGIARRYFRSKTSEISELATRIAVHLMRE